MPDALAPGRAGPPAARPLPAVARLFPDLYYGWTISLGAALICFVGVGIGFYGLGVFLDALVRERGWSKSQVSGATAVYFAVNGIAGALVGRSIDRHGARGWIFAGAALLAAGVVLLGRVRTPLELFAAYPLMALGHCMCTGLPTSAILARWFVAQRARAMSISFTGVSVGGVVLVPLTTRLIGAHGLETATLVLAGLLLSVVWPVALFVLRFDPALHGLRPDGAGPLAAAAAVRPDTPARRVSAREALASGVFWRLALAFGAILACQVGFLMHQIAFLSPRIGATAASLAVSATAGGSIVARLAVGSFADRAEKRRLGVALFVIQAASFAGFALFDAAPLAFVCSIALGCTIGNVFMLQSLLVAERFGLASFGSVVGLLQLVTQVGSALGPFALGALSEALGGYERPLLLWAGLASFGALVLATLPAGQRSAS
jgi:MFS family permease